MTTPKPRSFDLVIFDLDGTLVDTAPDIARALAAALAETGAATLPLEIVKELIGDGARVLIERALLVSDVERKPGDVDALLARFLAYYRAHVSDRSVVYDGMAEALAGLAAAGIAVAVVTNKPGDIARRVLGDLGLADRFRAIIGDGDGYPRKPDPAAARAVIAMVGTRPERTAVVGDGIADIRMARAAGARIVAATWGYGFGGPLVADPPDALAPMPGSLVPLIV